MEPQTQTKQKPKNPEMSRDPEFNLPVVKATGLVPVVVLQSSAAEGYMYGEVRGIAPKVASRCLANNPPAVKLYDFNNPAANRVQPKRMGKPE